MKGEYIMADHNFTKEVRTSDEFNLLEKVSQILPDYLRKNIKKGSIDPITIGTMFEIFAIENGQRLPEIRLRKDEFSIEYISYDQKNGNTTLVIFKEGYDKITLIFDDCVPVRIVR